MSPQPQPGAEPLPAPRRERLSRVDRAFLNMERATNPMMILALIVLGAPLDRTRFRQRVAERFVAFDRFRCIPVEGLSEASWEPSERFDIDDHVLSAALTAPAGQRELEMLVGELASEPLPSGRPLWSFHLVERFGRGSVIIARIHHCYADGIALVQVLMRLADGGPSPARAPASAPAVASAPVSALAPGRAAALLPAWVAGALSESTGLIETGVHLALHPLAAASAARGALGLAGELARISLLPDDPPTRLRRPLSGIRRVAWGDPLSLEEVKTIGRVLGCTVNDVLVSTLAGALGRYLEQQGEAITGLSLRAAVPVNLRSGDGTDGSLGNRFGLVFVELPIGVRHPLERLYRVRSAMQAIKGSEQSVVTYGLLAAVGSLPRPIEDLAMGLFSAKASLVASNLRGPDSALSVAGSPVRQVLFWVPQSGSIGTGVSMLSYHGRVQFGIIADREVIPRPGELVALIETAFEQLVLLVLLGGAALGT